MNIGIHKYGEVLKILMDKYMLTISSFTLKCGLSSRNVLTRILTDRCRYNAIFAFHQGIRKNPSLLPFNERDWEDLENSLDVSKYGVTRVCAYNMLLSVLSGGDDFFYYGSCASPKLTACYSSEKYVGKSIDDFLIEVSSEPDAEIEIRVFASVSCWLCVLLLKLLRTAKAKLRITHYVIAPASDDDYLLNSAYVFPLLNYENYECLEFTPENISGLPNGLMMVKRGSGEGETYNWFNILPGEEDDCENSFIGISGIDDDQINKYFNLYFKLLSSKSHPARRTFDDQDEEPLERLYDISSFLRDYEKEWMTILIQDDFCVNEIDTSLLCRAMCGEDIPPPGAAAALYESEKARHEILLRNDRSDIHIFSAEGVSRFISTGWLSDQPEGMRAFDRSEIKEIMRGWIELAENVKGFRLYMLKTSLPKICLKLCGDKLALFESKDFNATLHTSFFCCDGRIVTLLREFILNELIPKFTYPHAKSLSYIKEKYSEL